MLILTLESRAREKVCTKADDTESGHYILYTFIHKFNMEKQNKNGALR